MARGGVRDFAARRSAKLAAQQASLPESERLVNRKDWDKRVSRPVSVMSRQARKNARNAFVEIMTSPSVARFDSADAAEAMFQVGGRPFTCDILRQFLEASALSRDGTVVDGVQSTRSLRGLLLNLFGAAVDSGNPVEREVKKNSILWIDCDLLPRGLAHRVARKKLVALPDDITSLLRRLFDPQFICTLPTTRDPLLTALFICLMVDCAGRPSEFLCPNMSEENKLAYKKEHPEKIFTWERVELFAFPPLAEGQSVRLQARLTFQSIKDTGNKGFKPKVIPLRLLPAGLIAEDSLFWLLTLGLIDQVFDGISTWADFDRLRPGPLGLPVAIKSCMLQTPVFRSASRTLSSSSDPLIRENQMGSQAMNEILHDLSRYCGLEHSVLPNVLRRSAAYILANTTTKEERAARMGHSDKDSTYWSSYRNTASTVDFQGLRFSLEEESVTAMSSVFLGSSASRTPPQKVSEEGMQAVHQDQQLRDLLARQTPILDALLTAHGSLNSAKIAGGEQHRQYKQLGDQYSKRKSHLVKAKYNEEYKQYFATVGETAPALSHQPAAASLDQSDLEKYNFDKSNLDRDDIEELLDLDEAGDLDDVEIPIDPLLLGDETQGTADPVHAGVPVVDTIESEAIGTADVISADVNNDTTSTSRSFAPRAIGRHTLVDLVPHMLYEQPPEGLDRTTLSNFFCDAFNHLHAADKFYPNQEPFPGTFDCRFCGEHFLELNDNRAIGSAHLHADLCEAALFADNVLDDLRSKHPVETAVTTCPLSTLTSGTPCKTKLGTPRAFMAHCMNYHRDSTQRYACNSHPAPLHFEVFTDLATHAVKVHGAPISIIQSHTKAGKLTPLSFIYFCPFCQVYIARQEQLECDHLATHMQDFANAIAARGMAGVWMFNRWAYPAFCPFCAYDTGLHHLARMHQFGHSRMLLAHIASHIKDMDKPIPCPATSATPEGLPQCDDTAALDSVQMAAHLAKSHGLNVKMPQVKTVDDPGEPSEPAHKKTKKDKRKSGTVLGEIDVNSAS